MGVARRAKSTGESTGALVPQKHGGALSASPAGGVRPGAGRPPSYIRQVARESFEKRIPILERIADSDEERSQDRIAAIRVLADTGGVDKLALTVEEQPEQVITPERAADIYARLEVVKSVRNIEKLLTGGAGADRAD